MKHLPHAVVLSVLFAALSVSAQSENTYLRLSAGTGLLTDSTVQVFGGDDATAEFDAGYALSAAYGQTSENISFLRAEIEVDVQKNSLSSIGSTFRLGGSTGGGEVFSLRGMINGYIDIPTGIFVTPYLLAGAGGNYVDVDLDGYSDNTFVVAAQIGGGAAFEITERVSVDARYRYVLSDNAKFQEVAEMEYSAHLLQVGLSLSF